MNINSPTPNLATVNPRALWVIQMIKTAGYIDGMYRLHKYAFLLCKTVKNIDKVGLYNDWSAGDYGPYSQQLQDDIDSLKKEGIIQVDEIANDLGRKTERYTTNAGKDVTEQLERSYSEKEYKEVVQTFRKIINTFGSKRTIELLYDIYLRFPQYAVRTKKLDDANTKLTEYAQ